MDDEAALAAARGVAADVLAPQATAAERDGVPRASIDALAAAGLLAVAGPAELGGLSPAAGREVAELLAGASPDAWFVWMQHHLPVRLVTETSNVAARERLLPELCAGRMLAAVAFSHLRRPHPGVHATRVGRGWRIQGTVPWLTSWGLADVVALGALTDDGDVLFAMVPLGADAPPGLVATPALELASMQGTRTVGLQLNGVVVPDDAVVLREPTPRWREEDALRAANVVPATFGIANAALAGLRAAVGAPGAEQVGEVADELAAALAATRERAYALMDDAPADQAVGERIALRAQALGLTLRATAADIAVHGGRAMGAEHPAQRQARAALFLLVQAQTPLLRAATLARLRP